MIIIALVVALATLAGLEARRRTERADRWVELTLDFVLWVLIPVVAFIFASRLELTLSTLAGIGLGYLVIATVAAIAWQVSGRWMHLERRQQGAVVLSALLANTGYLGLPVAATLLGSDELPQAVIWDLMISVPMALIIAPFIAAPFASAVREASIGQQLVSTLKRAPAIPAVVIGLLVPGSWVPDWLLDTGTWLVYLTLPLGFFAVGAIIQRLRGDDDHPPRAPVALAVGLRILVAPLLYAALHEVLIPAEPRAFMLQAAMPCGLNALVVAHAFDLDRGLIATAIAWSTGIMLTGALVASTVL